MATESPTSTNEVPTPCDEGATHTEKKESPQPLHDNPQSSHTSQPDVTPESDQTEGEKEVVEGGENGEDGEDGEESLLEILDREQLEERLGEARKAVIVGKYEDAIHLLPSCLATITGEEGELSIHLAEPHYLYGKSLFECARSGAGMFGEGMLKEESKDGEGEGESSGEDEVPAESTEEVNETEPSNFELAWENLEVSRVISSKHLEKNKTDLSIAEILLKTLTCLGELQVETGCYEKATSDYADCLQLLDKFPDISTKQLLGATHYSMGISCSLSGEHEQAVLALETALSSLKELLSEKEEDSVEAKTLKELIEEIVPRIAEAKEQMERSQEATNSSDQPTSSSNGAQPCPPPESSNKIRSRELGAVQVNDISHLVRKKRPAGDTDEETSSKRAMSEHTSSPDES